MRISAKTKVSFLLAALLPFPLGKAGSVLSVLAAAAIAACLLYVVLFYGLRSIFRRFEHDIALVTLYISKLPALIVFILVSLKLALQNSAELAGIEWIERSLTAGLVITTTYWLAQLFTQVVAYYLKEYAQASEAMWDDVLIPILEGVIPLIIYPMGGLILLYSFGVNLTGIGVTLGGAAFVLGFALQDILANFFSGLVLLLDTPFQFGDVVCLEDGTLAMLQKIGIRVTQLYRLDTHCAIYIPNSTLQGKNIVNLSRPTTHYYSSIHVTVRLETCDPAQVQKLMREIVLGHPDTLGDMDEKLQQIDNYYKLNQAKQKAGYLRLLAEKEVNGKLEEIEQALEALVVTLQCAEKGGLNQEDIEMVQQEYRDVLNMVGLKASTELQGRRLNVRIEETQRQDSLINLVREWYRVWLREPDLFNEDQYVLSSQWERKIQLLKRKVEKLFKTFTDPQREETRLHDRVTSLLKWLREQFKQSKHQWQETKVWITGVAYDKEFTFTKFTIKFYVDDMRLEHGERGNSVNAEVYREITQHIKQALLH